MPATISADEVARTVQRRRDRLRLWFDSHTIPAEEKSYISQLINGKAAFGEKAARRLEGTYSMPPFYLDAADPDVVALMVAEPQQPYGTSNATRLSTGDTREPLPVTTDEFVEIPMLANPLGAGDGGALEEYDKVDGAHAYRREWIEKKGFSIPMLRVVPVKGDSMIPYVFDGNKVLVNLAARRVIDGRHYAIRIGDENKIKRLFTQGDGRIRIESYNAPVDYIGRGDDAEVIGEVVDRKGT